MPKNSVILKIFEKLEFAIEKERFRRILRSKSTTGGLRYFLGNYPRSHTEAAKILFIAEESTLLLFLPRFFRYVLRNKKELIF